MPVKLLRDIDESECAERNALSNKISGYVLRMGEIGEIVDTFEDGAAFLVEFGQGESGTCDWLGVLYAAEVEPQSNAAIAA